MKFLMRKKRKKKNKDINLQITSVEPWVNEENGFSGLDIYWNSSKGFGQYRFQKHKDSPIWEASSEAMDNNADKSFGQKLLSLWLESTTVY